MRAVAEASHRDDAVEQAYSALGEGFIALMTQAIEARVARGDMAALDALQIARALVRMLNAYLEDTLGHESGTDPERVLETVWTIWTRTLFPAS